MALSDDGKDIVVLVKGLAVMLGLLVAGMVVGYVAAQWIAEVKF